LTNLLGSFWGLSRVSERAISDSETALEQQANSYLLELAESRAALTNQALGSAQQIAVTVGQTATNPPPNAQSELIPLITADDGRRYQQRLTTAVLPHSPEISALNELTFSSPLDQVFPSIARLSPDILRISYMTADGLLRTFPPITPADVPVDWQLETDIAFLVGETISNTAPTLVWMDVHEVFAGDDPVISAVQSVFREGRYVGIVVVDVSIDRLTTSLGQIQVGQNGFPVVLNQSGNLIASTQRGQEILLGKVPASLEEQRAIKLAEVNPGLAAFLQNLSNERATITPAEIKGQRYLLAAAPIAEVKWNLVLAYPFDEITASTQSTTKSISDIAQQTQLLNLLLIVLLTLVIGFGLRYLLRRQLVNPLAALIEATESVAAGNLQTINMTYNDEMGQLASSFNTMTTALSDTRAEILATNQRLEQAVQERTAELQTAMRETASALTTQQELVQTLNRVSSPIIPVIPGVLAMPLIGQLTAERANFATQELLHRIETTRVELILLDLTGVPVLEPNAAQALRHTVTASYLLGARTMLVGITPEVAQMLVSLDLDMHTIDTAADLQSAIAQVLRSRMRKTGKLG
jgi:anti-anti-sigma regulatory factor/HAMP domain-containing protein